mmetsp:Transcript_30026/g.73929  ORF Transcript_30026/g.73929 Transcript_30026/m.73929 type:complete len:252 (-) Transcript_30026:191-946(-)
MCARANFAFAFCWLRFLRLRRHSPLSPCGTSRAHTYAQLSTHARQAGAGPIPSFLRTPASSHGSSQLRAYTSLSRGSHKRTHKSHKDMRGRTKRDRTGSVCNDPCPEANIVTTLRLAFCGQRSAHDARARPRRGCGADSVHVGLKVGARVALGVELLRTRVVESRLDRLLVDLRLAAALAVLLLIEVRQVRVVGGRFGCEEPAEESEDRVNVVVRLELRAWVAVGVELLGTWVVEECLDGLLVDLRLATAA